MKKVIFLAILLLTVVLSSCMTTKLVKNSTALKHSGAFSPNAKLGDGVHVVATSYSLPKWAPTQVIKNEIKLSILFRAAELTLKKGYSHFIIIRDQKNDTELLKAIKNKTVRELCLKRIKKKSPLVNKPRVLIKYTYPRNHPELKTATEFYASTVVVMFKKEKIGVDAAKIKMKISEIAASNEKARIKKDQEEIKKHHPLVRKLIYE